MTFITYRPVQESQTGSDNETTQAMLREAGARLDVIGDSDELLGRTAELLASEKVVGWCQGRMEFGPPALGARSILGDPRSGKMQKITNLKVKHRESFRPFAPSVLREDIPRYFETDVNSPYTLLVDRVKPEICRELTEEVAGPFGIERLNVSRSELPAITHVDCTARVQTVHRETNPLYYRLIEKFKEKTGCSVLINTSFNVRGEPPVCTPVDVFKRFIGTEMDHLVGDNCLLHREAQDPSLRVNFKAVLELD